MTPARKAALQWFHDRGAVRPPMERHADRPGERMLRSMVREKQINITAEGWTLTDKGRRMLHGDQP